MATRNTAVMPFKVAKAAMPITMKTTIDFKLPLPMRTSVLLPQPEASTIPKPNIKPPTMAEAQAMRELAYKVLLGSIFPRKASSPKPSIATPAAQAHWRMRCQSPMFTMSLTAPMVQKCVRCAMAPKTKDNAKEASSTWAERELRSEACMRVF